MSSYETGRATGTSWQLRPDAAAYPSGKTTARSLPIDLLKGLAILAVLVQHALSARSFHYLGAPLYIHEAVGVFMVLAGYNGAQAYARRGVSSLAQAYAWPVLSRSLLRLLPLYCLVWVMEVAIYPHRGQLRPADYLVSFLRGGWGWGNYFVPVIVTNVFVLPLLYQFARRHPALLLPVAFALDLAFELAAYRLHLPGPLYEPNYLRYLFAVALGLWLAMGRPRPGLLLALAAGGLLFVYGQEYGGLSVPFQHVWASRSLLAAGFAVGCVAVGLRHLPARSDNPLWQGPAAMGRASYHIFLVQGIFFWRIYHAQPPSREPAGLVLAIILLGILGWLIYRAEGEFRRWPGLRLPSLSPARRAQGDRLSG